MCRSSRSSMVSEPRVGSSGSFADVRVWLRSMATMVSNASHGFHYQQARLAKRSTLFPLTETLWMKCVLTHMPFFSQISIRVFWFITVSAASAPALHDNSGARTKSCPRRVAMANAYVQETHASPLASLHMSYVLGGTRISIQLA